MVTTGLIVRLEAKSGKEEQLATFLRTALALVQAEPQTVAWLAVRIGVSSFAIVDGFPDEAGRQAHLDGAVAAALRDKAADLLSAPPEIRHVDVLAAKLPVNEDVTAESASATCADRRMALEDASESE